MIWLRRSTPTPLSNTSDHRTWRDPSVTTSVSTDHTTECHVCWRWFQKACSISTMRKTRESEVRIQLVPWAKNCLSVTTTRCSCVVLEGIGRYHVFGPIACGQHTLHDDTWPLRSDLPVCVDTRLAFVSSVVSELVPADAPTQRNDSYKK